MSGPLEFLNGRVVLHAGDCLEVVRGLADASIDAVVTALKPAVEPIILARKPLSGTVAANVLAHGTGALNVGACRVGDEGGTSGAGPGPAGVIYSQGLNGSFGQLVPGLGRWPANVVHDGSPQVAGCFPVDGDGSAARFFYGAKADFGDRVGSKHPTVKPVDLMQWLVRLICPPGGVVLDPFAGTGTTGAAAWREGFRAVLIEREAEYRGDIARRMTLEAEGPATRAAESARARHGETDAGPLFGGDAARGGGRLVYGTFRRDGAGPSGRSA